MASSHRNGGSRGEPEHLIRGIEVKRRHRAESISEQVNEAVRLVALVRFHRTSQRVTYFVSACAVRKGKPSDSDVPGRIQW